MLTRILCLGLATSLFAYAAPSAQAKVILNEGNAVGVSSTTWLQVDFPSKPYEGYDFGIVIPHSGNNNSPLHPTDPGNPLPPDIDSSSGIQTTLPNGWELANATSWGRIFSNGGDWLEFVITEDHTDLRGYTFYWENDDNEIGSVGSLPSDRGVIKLTTDAAWSDLRAGTIITISEDQFVDEVRDDFPDGLEGFGVEDTGHDYDLSTDLTFDPANDDWHIHFHLDETLTDAGTATQYFEGFSDIKVDNDDWRMAIFDASNTALTAATVNSAVPRSSLDLTTGMVQDFVGESATDWGLNSGAGGVDNDEVFQLIVDPTTGAFNGDYEDTDFSTFGSPNMFNVSTESTLDGVQDFSTLRSWFSAFDPADLNQDTFVDGLDLGILLGNWGATTTPDMGELDGTPPVDGLDLGILLGAWNPPPAAAVIPEPTTLALFAIGLALVGVRRS